MLMKSKKKQKQNYIILAIIYIAVIVLVIYLASWYNTYVEYKEEIPVLQNVISEINPNEVDHYLMENPSPILYLCSASDSECRSFEESIKSSLESGDFQDLTYVNLEDIDHKTSYLVELLDKYDGSNFTVSRIPCLIKFTDGRVTAIEDGLNGALLTKDEALNFIDANNANLGE